LYVRTPGAQLSKKEDELLQEAFGLARNFGGKIIELEGDSVAQEIIKYVCGAGSTAIVMGQSARSRLQEIVRGSIINKIMRETHNIDIIVVADMEECAG
jgi:two-component system, OmpR family, sensor histidine kinase KdpD